MSYCNLYGFLLFPLIICKGLGSRKDNEINHIRFLSVFKRCSMLLVVPRIAKSITTPAGHHARLLVVSRRHPPKSLIFFLFLHLFPCLRGSVTTGTNPECMASFNNDSYLLVGMGSSTDKVNFVQYSKASPGTRSFGLLDLSGILTF